MSLHPVVQDQVTLYKLGIQGHSSWNRFNPERGAGPEPAGKTDCVHLGKEDPEIAFQVGSYQQLLSIGIHERQI